MTGGTKIRVLLAEDSPSVRLFLVHLLESDPAIRVVGAVTDGQAAVDFFSTHQADVVLMDLYMPKLDGFEATRQIMETNPLPIVICSAMADAQEMSITFRSLEAGAVACIEKPRGREDAGFAVTSARLLETVRLMSEVKVVRRSPRGRRISSTPPLTAARLSPSEIRGIGIGASTGGPPALQTILAHLPKDFPSPLFVVQHIALGFLAGMVEWLNQTSPLTVQVASYGMVPREGHVYLAPDDFHMGIGAGGTISLSRELSESGVRPSVAFLFRSMAATYGRDAVGVLLTGMGRDGADELKLMKEQGAVTIAQDRETSVVHGMPGEAIAVGGATHILPLDRIADTLVALVNSRRKGSKELAI